MTPRRIRLLSGLILFAYLAAHLLNHALGIISLSLAEAGLRLAVAFWRTPVATVLLYGAAAVHFALALWTLASRREWRLPPIEIVRLAAGFSFPLLLIGHVVAVRLGDALFAIRPTYVVVVANLLADGRRGLQLALLAPGWLHGCLGLWIALRRFELARRMKPLLVACVVFIPLLAALGFWRMASEVPELGPRPASVLTAQQSLGVWRAHLATVYISLVVAALIFGRLRALASRQAL
jgi:adenylate cyclase